MQRLRTGAALVAIAMLSACGPASGDPATPSPSASARSTVVPAASSAPSPAASPTPSPAPSPAITPTPTAGDAGGEGDEGAWVNGYIIPGSDDVHFGPEWGPTWYFEKTIGERFADWYAGAATVSAECPWVAVLDSYPESAVYSIALGDPRGDNGTALIFRMDNPGDASAPRPINAEGLSIGSTMDEVLAAYPGTSVQFFNDEAWGDVYEIDVFQPATDTHMFFWSFEPHGEVQDIQWGNFPQEVSWRGHTCAG